MAIVSGDFTASDLSAALIRSDQMWTNDLLKADFEGNVDIVTALRKEQNANVSILADQEKDRDVTVHWVNMCGESAEDQDGDDCDLAGNELGSDDKTYALGFAKQWKFSVDEMSFRTNNYNAQEVIAKGLLKGDKILSEAVAASALARVESFKGDNAVTDGLGTWDAVDTEQDIPAANWDSALFAHLYRVALQNQYSSPFLLSGSNLFEDWIVTQASMGNANGKGDANLFKMIRTYFDLLNIDSANSPKYKTYMINRGAIAFASKNYYGAKPTFYAGPGQTRYSVESKNLPGVRFDVHYTNRCSGSTIMHDFQMKLKYDFFGNPTGCDETRTGVIAFNKT